MIKKTSVDGRWDDLLGDDEHVPASPKPDPLPPPPAFEGASSDMRRSQSVIESLESLFRKQAAANLEQDPDSAVFPQEIAELVRASTRESSPIEDSPSDAVDDDGEPVSGESLAVGDEAPWARPSEAVSITHDIADDDSDPRRSSRRMVWMGGAAIAATAAIVAVAMASGSSSKTTPPDPQPDPAPAVASHNPKPVTPAEDPKPEPEPEPEPEPTPAEVDPTVPTEPSDAADPVPTPAEPSPPGERGPKPKKDPEPSPTSDAQPSDDARATGEEEAEYEKAAAEWSETNDPNALATMIKAACRMYDGPKARAGFRRLAPKDLRVEVLGTCEELGISLRAKEQGFTPAEMIKRARRFLDLGDAKTALSTAREANKIKRSTQAIFVMALAACELQDADEAKRLRKHVDADEREEIDAACARRDITFDPPPE